MKLQKTTPVINFKHKHIFNQKWKVGIGKQKEKRQYLMKGKGFKWDMFNIWVKEAFIQNISIYEEKIKFIYSIS